MLLMEGVGGKTRVEKAKHEIRSKSGGQQQFGCVCQKDGDGFAGNAGQSRDEGCPFRSNKRLDLSTFSSQVGGGGKGKATSVRRVVGIKGLGVEPDPGVGTWTVPFREEPLDPGRGLPRALERLYQANDGVAEEVGCFIIRRS